MLAETQQAFRSLNFALHFSSEAKKMKLVPRRRGQGVERIYANQKKREVVGGAKLEGRKAGIYLITTA